MNRRSGVDKRISRRTNTIVFGSGIAVVAALLMLSWTLKHAATPAYSGAARKGPVVTLEVIPGSPVLRVILTAKAAERLGIETAPVGEEWVTPKQMVGGTIIPPIDKQPEAKRFGGGFSDGCTVEVLSTQQSAAPRGNTDVTGRLWVLVTLSPSEWDRLDKNKPARVFPLATRENSMKEVIAYPSGNPPREDLKRSMLSLYYVIDAEDHGLAMNSRVRVDLTLSASEGTRKVVPYSAVYYDPVGQPWVYVNGSPLTYIRQPVTVDRIVGNTAVLFEGPSIGTPVVTVGAALLYGAEIFGK